MEKGELPSRNTVLGNVPGADHLNQMGARKLIYRMMVIAPAVFLAGIGVNARTIVHDFDTIENDPNTEEAIAAYIPYVRESFPYVKSPQTPIAKIRSIGADWAKGAAEGKLNTLRPVEYDDTITDGVKSQIHQAKSRLVARLLIETEQEVKAGKVNDAARDALMAINVSQILKYSDFLSLYNCSVEERRAIHLIKPCFGQIEPNLKSKLSAALLDAKSEEHKIALMISHSRRLFCAWRNRKGFKPLDIEDTQAMLSVPATIKSEGFAVAVKELKGRMVASRDSYLPAFYSSLRLGLGAHQLLADDTTRLLNSTKASQ